MTLSPDEILYTFGPLTVNATLLFTWVVMALLVGAAVIVGRGFRVEPPIGRAQLVFEALVSFVLDQIDDVTRQDPRRYLPFAGTLFIFILTCNVLSVVPGFQPPTGSLSTTTALALAVFLAVPAFGIAKLGLRRYLRTYIEPTPFMLPFTVLGEITRTIALAVRLFGNIMSGQMVGGILLLVAGLLIPIPLVMLGLLTGAIQAYIFGILATVYIAAAVQVEDHPDNPQDNPQDESKQSGAST